MSFESVAAYEFSNALGKRDMPVSIPDPRAPWSISRREEAGQDAETLVSELISAHRRVVHDQGELLEALESALAELVRDCAPRETGSREVDSTFERGALPAADTEVLLCMDPADLEEDRFCEVLRYAGEASARGVAVRCICAESMVNVPGGRAHINELQGAGADVRIVALLPFRLLLADHRIAHMHMVGRDGEDVHMEITDLSACQFVRQVFDYCWLAKTSLRFSPEGCAVPGDFSERELIILRMLANGMKDEAMARALGVSTRTLRRAITDIMGKLKASSRFQMGARAAEYRLLWSSVPGG